MCIIKFTKYICSFLVVSLWCGAGTISLVCRAPTVLNRGKVYTTPLNDKQPRRILFETLSSAGETPCDIGYAREDSICKPCTAGTYWYRSATGTEKCIPCPLGFYSTENAKTQCEWCATKFTKATSRIDCVCSAGYRRLTSKIFNKNDAALTCQRCDSEEWCKPSSDPSYWTVKQLCGVDEPPEFCSHFATSSYPSIWGRCPISGSCPTVEDVEKNDVKCQFPYTGVKCYSCISSYVKSLVSREDSPCIPCLSSWLFLFIAFVMISLQSVSLCLAPWERDSTEFSELIIFMRTFIQHWQHLTILRYAHIVWPKRIAIPMGVITMGVPLIDLITCFFSYKSRMSLHPVYSAIQMSTFLPLVFGIWSCGLMNVFHFVYKRTGIRSWSVSRADSLSSIKLALSRSMHAASSSDSVVYTSISVFFFMYFLLFVDFAGGLFYGVSCVKVEATGLFHAAAALDIVCSRPVAWHIWVLPAILLYVWLIPVAFSTYLWYKVREWRLIRRGYAWGYFIHGYQDNALAWQCVVLLRLALMITIVGLCPTYTQPPFRGIFGVSQFYTLQFPSNSALCPFLSLLAVFLIYTSTECVRETFRIINLGAMKKHLFLQRLSMIAITLSLCSAIFSKLDANPLVDMSGSTHYATTERISLITHMNHRLVSVEQSIAEGMGMLALLFHGFFIFFFGRAMLNLLQYVNAPRIALHKLPCFIRIKDFFVRYTDRSRLKYHYYMERINRKNDTLPVIPFLPSQMCSPRNVPVAPLPLLRRSSKLGVIRPGDVTMFKSCLRYGTPATNAQILSALLRLTLQPFSQVATYTKGICFLSQEGFPVNLIFPSVHEFYALRNDILMRLETLPRNRIEDLSWISRDLILLRYPVLEDPRLQVTSLTESRLNEVRILCYQYIFKHTPLQNASQEDLLPHELEILFGRRSVVTQWISWCLRGRVISNEFLTQILYKQMYYEELLDRDTTFTCELCQRVLQCLVLDYAFLFYELPFSIAVDAYLAQGVPLGTRNDGRTDALIRRRVQDMKNVDLSSVPVERSASYLRQACIVRRRKETRAVKYQSNQQLATPVTSPNDSFKDFFGAEQSNIQKLTETVQVINNFLQVFPDARRVLDPSTHTPHPVPDPQYILALVKNTSNISKNNVVRSAEEDTWACVLQQCVESLANSLLNVNNTSRETNAGSHCENRVETPTMIVQRKDAIPLFLLTSIQEQFIVEPTDVGIYTTDGLQFIEGPDGSSTGIITDKKNCITDDSTSSSAYQSIFLDPMVEICSADINAMISNQAQWTLECWMFLPETSRTEEKCESNEVKIKTLCASESGESLFSINTYTGEMGLWNPYSEPHFEPLQPYGHIIHPLTLSDLAASRWHFITATFEAHLLDPSDKQSKVQTTFTVYINAKAAGGIVGERLIRNIEVIGNNVCGQQPFGTFSGICVWPYALYLHEVKEHYASKKRKAKRRLK